MKLTPPAMRTLIALYPNGCDIISGFEPDKYVHAEGEVRGKISGTLVGLAPGTWRGNTNRSAGCIGLERDAYLKMVDKAQKA